MINFLTDCSFCKDSAVFSVIYLIKQVMQIVFIIIPIILIVLLIVDIAKNVIAGNTDDMNKNKKLAIRRVIYALIIFLIPSIVNLFMRVMYDVVDSGSEQSFLECWKNADDVNKVNQCNAEVIASENASDIEKKRQSDEKIATYQQEVQNNKTSGGLGAKQEENTANNDGNSSNTNSNLASTINNYTVYTGDSRTNLMCIHTKLAPDGGGSNNGNEKCIVGPGKAYTYFHGTILKEIEKELTSYNDANIVLASWGTNDISPNIYNGKESTYAGTYFSKLYAVDYKYLAEKYPNAKFIVVSVMYFREKGVSALHFKLTNDLVDNFNNNIKSNVNGVSNIVYCDINSVLGTSLYSTDGIHYYGSDNNKKILDEIKKCI